MLATFVLIQTARTAQAAADANEMVDKFGKLMLRNSLTDPKLIAALEHLTIGLTEPASEALRPAVLETPVILDLRFKVLHNQSSTPFVLGDHPAVKHNQLYSGENVSMLGLANSGLQIVMPLSPQYAITFFDENAYSLGGSVSNIVRLTSSHAVNALNEFQWANAHENVYFLPDKAQDLCPPDRQRLAEIRLGEHVSVEEGVTERKNGDQMKVISVQTQRPSRSLSMPLFRARIRPSPLKNKGLLPLRDPDWALHVHGLTKAFNEGAIPPEEFHVRTMPPQFLRRILQQRYGRPSLEDALIEFRKRQSADKALS